LERTTTLLNPLKVMTRPRQPVILISYIEDRLCQLDFTCTQTSAKKTKEVTELVALQVNSGIQWISRLWWFHIYFVFDYSDCWECYRLTVHMWGVVLCRVIHTAISTSFWRQPFGGEWYE